MPCRSITYFCIIKTMTALKKIFALGFASFYTLCCFARTTYSVGGTVNGCKQNKIFLSWINGKQIKKADSTLLDNNCSFSFMMPAYTGVLRISMTDSDYADIIFNNENIQINFASSQLSSGAEIIKSEENKIYFDFLSQTNSIEDSANALISLGQQLYDADPSGNVATLKKLMKQIDELRKRKNNICFKISDENKNLYASKLIKAAIVPDFAEYKKNKDAASYPNEAAFLKEHFFDYTDFSDSTLLNSDVFFKKCGDYIGYFADPPSTLAYNDCIDFILVRAQSNKNVYTYVVNTMVSTFEHSGWEDVYLHIVEKYNEASTCSDNTLAKELNSTSSIIKLLKEGNKAPSIKIPDLSGKMQILDSLNSKYTLVLFWASWCEFCEDAMPELKKIYEAYQSKGFEIFAVSCDSIKEEWQAASKKYDIKWLNTCDLKGFKSEAIINYHVWQTPTFFLLDKDKKIIAKPLNTAALKKELEGLEF
jgi:thiol-disulfide isomerase/thioredoxin